MILHHAIRVGLLATISMSQPRITERTLADIAVISIPASIKNETNRAYTEEQTSRLTFQFSSTYFWASLGSITTYKELMIVSIMGPDATDAEYAALPRAINMRYEQRKKIQTSAVGSGTLTITEGIYTRGSLSEPSVEYVYSDKARRLQLAWHAVKNEVDVATAVAQIARIASSFRIIRDPITTFAEMRAAPGKDTASRAGKLATVKAMLQREGYASLEPGKPVLRNGVYLEWMSDPEPRYQLLVPLGRVRAAANGSVVNRPRPAFRASDPKRPPMAGTIGWREIADGEWVFGNQDDDYLPFKGVGALLAAAQQDRAFVYFYYVATVRVEEQSDDRLLTSLRWFLDGLPDVQRRWRDGTLVTPGTPEKD